MSNNIYGFVVLFGVSIGTALGTYALVRVHLRALLDEVIKLSSGTTFYLRLFAISLFFVVLSSALGTTFDLKPEAAFMEYVWKVAHGISSLFALTTLLLFGYLLLITVLVAVLRHGHE